MRAARRVPTRFAVRPLSLALAGGSLLSLLPGPSPAQVPPVLPSGLTVIQGQARAVTNGNKLTVTNSANSILNWQSFSIGAANSVSFVQPNAQSQVLNRVVGNDPSSILGSLTSNGKVWLLNPNGVIFGQGARVDVAGLVTSTLNLNDTDWLGGRYLFSAAGTPAGIVNRGELRSSLGGHIALLGGSVRNEGLIEASGGQVLLAAGQSIELIDTGSPNLRLKLTAPVGEALNLGTLAAAGGRIDVHAAVVNQQGVVRAGGLGTNAAGEIVLAASERPNPDRGGLTSASVGSGATKALDSGEAGTAMPGGDGSATGSAGSGGGSTGLGRSPAGEIVLTASESLNLARGSVTSASGGTGGSLLVDSGPAGTTMVSGDVLATGSAGTGGHITLLGRNVGVVDAARVDASGSAGGGQIHVGGGERGQDPALRNAQGVYVGKDASLAADATAQGDGGKIVLWGDLAMRAYGSFTARGGALGGNGGFVETSGGWIDVNPAQMAVTAPAGRTGTWLIDPWNLLITDSASDSNVLSFIASGSPAILSTATINAALNGGNDVVITSFPDGTEAGNITVDNATITFTGNRSANLVVQALNDLSVRNSTISSTGEGALSVTLTADRFVKVSDSSITTGGSGLFVRAFGAASTSSGGSNLYSVELDNVGLTTGGVDIQSTGSVLLRNSTINTSGGGFFSTSGGGPIDSTRFESTSLATGGGNVAIRGSLDGSAGYTLGPGVGFFGNYSIDAGAGSVEIEGSVSGGQFGGDLGQSTGVRFFGNGVISAASIYISGTAGDPLPGGSNQSIGVDGFSSTTLNGTDFVSITGIGRDYGVRFSAFGQGNPLTVNGGNVAIYGESAVGGLRSTVLTGSIRGSFVQVGGNRSLELFATLDSGGGIELSSADLAIFRRSVTAEGQLNVRSLNVQLGLGGSLNSNATGDAIVVNGGFGTENAQQFTNSAGASALSAVNGRWLVYSTDPGTDTVDSLAYDFKQYDALYGSASGVPAGSGNGLLYSLAPTLTASGGPLNKVYDATTQTELLASSGVTLSGGIHGDSVGFSSTGRGSYSDKNVGDGKAITVDSSAVEAFDSNNKPVYGYKVGEGLQGNITPKTLTFTGMVASNKVYDGGVTVSIGDTGEFTGLEGGENLGFGFRVTFDTKDVGTGKTVTADSFELRDGNSDGGLNGGLASNYKMLADRVTTTADITPAPLSIRANDAAKTFGTTLSFSGSEFTASGLVGGETVGSVSLASPGAAATASVAGGPYAITPSNATGGSFSASNYSISYADGVLVVNPAALTAVLASIVGNPTKVYDGTTTATLTASNFSLSGFVGTDNATVSRTSGSYDSANAGSRTVSTTLSTSDFTSVGSTDLRNYALPTSASGNGTITPKTLTLTGLVANNKVYDGSVVATLSSAGTLGGLVGGQTLTLNNSGASFDTKDAGTGKTVTVTGIALGNGGNGGLAGNYRVAGSATTTADITPAPLTITASNAVKTFGSTLTFSGSEFTASGLIGSETVGRVSLGSPGAVATASVAGGPYAITPSNATGGSFAAANYTITYRNGSLTVTPAAINAVLASIVGNPTKAYDGSTTATLGSANYSLSGFFGSDGATVTRNNASYDSANAGARTVTATLTNADFTPTGSTDLRNYTLPTTASGSGTITPRTLTLTGLAANNKVYDGTRVATLGNAGALDGLVAGQTLTLSNTGASFDTQDAGTGKTVTVAGITLGNGTGLASNYRIAPSATTTADITPKGLTLASVSAANKVYDGNTAATVTLGGLVGLVGNETLGISSTAAQFDTKDVGAAKPVTIGGLALTDGTGRASNYQISATTASTTANITPAPLTITANDASKTFGTTLGFAGTEFTPAGLIGSETVGSVTLSSVGSTALASVAGGPYAIVASNATGGSFAAANYTITYRNGSLTVTPAAINAVLASIVGNPTKAYDGSTTATLGSANYSLSGFFGSDGATVTRSSASYDSANAGARTVTATLTNADFTPTGSTDLRNYTLPTTASGSGTITPRTLTLTGLAANNKVYDGTRVATLGNAGALDGLVAGQTLTLSNTGASFDTQDAGTGKTVTVAGITLGNGTGLASNYRIAPSATTTADITPKTLTLASVSAANKVYDGNTVASVTLGGLVGLVGSETLGTAASGTFDTKDAANGKTVTVGTTLANGSNGGLASNYRLAPSTTTTADITPKALTLASVSAANKVYDGNTAATVTLGGLVGLVGSETLGTAASGTFDTKDAANGKTVTVGTTLANGSNGGLASNYRLAPSTTTTADITPKALTLASVSAANKVYDGNTAATVTLGGLVGLVGSETLGTAASGTFDTKDAANGKTVTVGTTLANGSNGGLASNYRLAPSTTTTADITPKALTLTSVSAANKVYDGNTVASVTLGGLVGLVGSETLGTAASGTFDTKDAANGKTVTVTTTLSNGANGGLAGNYVLSPNPTTTTANITPKGLSLASVSAANKVYDGNTVASVTLGNLVGLVGSETLGTAATGTFDTKDAANGKTVTVGTTLANGSNGGLASNYRLAPSTTTTADITPKALTLASVSAANKVYDGNTVASVTLGGLVGLVGSETLGTSASGAFDTKDAGTAKTVTVGTTLANGSNGGLASNYRIAPSTTTTADITPKALTLASVSAANKVYDGNTAATVTLGGLVGLVGSETLGTAASGAFDTKDAANGKTVTVGTTLANGSNGGLASNYRLAPSTTTTADITPKALTLTSVSAANKVYDGNTVASVTLGGLVGLVGSETLGTSASGAFDTKDAGTAKTVTVGTTLANGSNGGLASNYRIAPSTTTTADITPKALTITGTSVADKVYDGTANVNVTLGTINGLVGNETLNATVSGSFDTKDAGDNKLVTIGVSLADGSNGGLASNYRFAPGASILGGSNPTTLALSPWGGRDKSYDGFAASASNAGGVTETGGQDGTGSRTDATAAASGRAGCPSSRPDRHRPGQHHAQDPELRRRLGACLRQGL